jgi:hypothetical protein
LELKGTTKHQMLVWNIHRKQAAPDSVSKCLNGLKGARQLDPGYFKMEVSSKIVLDLAAYKVQFLPWIYFAWSILTNTIRKAPRFAKFFFRSLTKVIHEYQDFRRNLSLRGK